LSTAKSWFVTPKRTVRPKHLPPRTDNNSFHDPSWFQRLVPIRPGPFVLPGADTSAAYDPFPPVELKGEPVGPRHYFGRVTDVLDGTLNLTLWEIPNGRELIANVARSKQKGVTTSGTLTRGTPIHAWTWTEHRPDGALERLHLEPMDRRAPSKKAARRHK
jgi:hypothetical protein